MRAVQRFVKKFDHMPVDFLLDYWWRASDETRRVYEGWGERG